MWYRRLLLWPCLLITFDWLAKARAQATSLASILAELGQNPVPYGPVPTGCSQFEILVGETN
jgi:hypothetical protein